MGKQARQDGLLGYAPVTNDSNLLDRLRRPLGQRGTGADGQCQHKQEAPNARGNARDEARSPRGAGDGSVLDLHRAGALRRAQVRFWKRGEREGAWRIKTMRPPPEAKRSKARAVSGSTVRASITIRAPRSEEH